MLLLNFQLREDGDEPLFADLYILCIIYVDDMISNILQGSVGRTDGRADGRTRGRVDGWMVGRLGGQTDNRSGGQLDLWEGGRRADG